MAIPFTAATLAGSLLLSAAWLELRGAETVSFTKQIRPILEERCWTCHGGAMQLSRLDLRTRENALKGGERGPALVPGNAATSRLFRLISGQEKPAMPMDGSHLSAEQIAAIRDWIDQGATWGGDTPLTAPAAAMVADPPLAPEARKYWAFRRPVKSPVPVARDPRSNRNPIDAFLAKSLEQRGLEPAPEAGARSLVRRAYLDLTGILPTPAEIASYISDSAPDRWERLVDRLLASRHYGERWGRHWLDVARYADSNGFEHDFDRPNAWRYRDYVIRAFNEDKPYDTFLKEQIAGDEQDRRTGE